VWDLLSCEFYFCCSSLVVFSFGVFFGEKNNHTTGSLVSLPILRWINVQPEQFFGNMRRLNLPNSRISFGNDWVNILVEVIFFNLALYLSDE